MIIAEVKKECRFFISEEYSNLSESLILIYCTAKMQASKTKSSTFLFQHIQNVEKHIQEVSIFDDLFPF